MSIISSFEHELHAKSPAEYARWCAVDLHNHTPVSFDYQGGDSTTAAQRSAEQIVSADLDVVMFTDHERLPDPRFIDEVRRRTKRLIIRGVELNVFVDAWSKPENKVGKQLFFHLLVGFDPDGKAGPDYWLEHLYQSCTATTREIGGQIYKGVCAPVPQVCEVLEAAGAIVIPAHLHTSKDAFKSRSVDDIIVDAEFLKLARDHFTALEVTSSETGAYFDGTHIETDLLHKSCIRSSDSHEPDKLGTRVAYVQMQRPSFQELKASLAIPARVRLLKPPLPDAYIYGLNVRGRFYPDLWLSLSPNCNAFIGVKGAGKTSVLECLRFVLGSAVPESRKESVNSHLSAVLGDAGSVRALIRRPDGAKVLIERSLNGTSYRATFEDDRHEAFTDPDALRFPAFILGWHEIEQAATDAKIRKVYLDTIAGREEIRAIQERIDIAVKRVRLLHTDASSKYSAYREVERQVARLDELRRGLQSLKDADLIALRNQYEAALTHRDAIVNLRNSTEIAEGSLTQKCANLTVTFESELAKAESPLSEHIDAANTLAETLRVELNAFASARAKRLTETKDALDAIAKKANEAFDRFLETYNVRVAELSAEQRNLLESHRRVMEETKALNRLQVDQDVQRKAIEETLVDLARLCREIATDLDRKTDLRREEVAKLDAKLRPLGVTIAVTRPNQYVRLNELNNKYHDGARIYGELMSFAQSESRHHRRLAMAYDDLRKDLVNGFHPFFDSAQFDYYVDFFEDDDLSISFKVGKTNEEFSPIDQLSAGQRCTAVFPLLLKLREGPLIVDQPEDNLDNRHIADAIAPSLTQDKGSRQIAFTSHNANLVVLTDAEHIVRFEGSGSRGDVAARGFLCSSASPITQDVIAILDGGEKALRLRYQKYGVR